MIIRATLLHYMAYTYIVDTCAKKEIAFLLKDAIFIEFLYSEDRKENETAASARRRYPLKLLCFKIFLSKEIFPRNARRETSCLYLINKIWCLINYHNDIISNFCVAG